MHWYLKAANQGFMDAENSVGYCYENGLGVERNLDLAVYWYQKAASEGLTLAQANLGRLYYNGLGVMKDHSEAMRWFRMAADQGFASAENQVGYSYAIGLGVKKDQSEAMRWFRKAADHGLDVARDNLKSLSDALCGQTNNWQDAEVACNYLIAAGADSPKIRQNLAAAEEAENLHKRAELQR